MSNALMDAIASAGDMKSISGKVTKEEYARFTTACETLGVSRNRAAAAALKGALVTLEAEAAKRPPKEEGEKKGKKGAAAADDVFGK